MRKLFAILACCCLLFVTSGYHVFYCYRIIEAKLEMKASLLSVEQEKLVQFEFTQKEIDTIVWEDDGQEFHFGNEMYDVLRIEKKDGNFVVYCISDQKEKALLDQYLTTHKRTSQHPSSSMAKLLTVQFLPVSTFALVAPKTSSTKAIDGLVYLLPTPSFTILTPPPQAC